MTHYKARAMRTQIAITAAFGLLLLVALPSHAISAKHRAALERSGCDMQTENTWCDIHKTKAQNLKNRPTEEDPALLKSTKQAERRDLEAYVRDSIIGNPKAEVANSLREFGFMRENDGDFYKITDRTAWHILLTYDSHGNVKTATVK